jgi:hypothetical protein
MDTFYNQHPVQVVSYRKKGDSLEYKTIWLPDKLVLHPLKATILDA